MTISEIKTLKEETWTIHIMSNLTKISRGSPQQGSMSQTITKKATKMISLSNPKMQFCGQHSKTPSEIKMNKKLMDGAMQTIDRSLLKEATETRKEMAIMGREERVNLEPGTTRLRKSTEVVTSWATLRETLWSREISVLPNTAPTMSRARTMLVKDMQQKLMLMIETFNFSEDHRRRINLDKINLISTLDRMHMTMNPPLWETISIWMTKKITVMVRQILTYTISKQVQTWAQLTIKIARARALLSAPSGWVRTKMRLYSPTWGETISGQINQLESIIITSNRQVLTLISMPTSLSMNLCRWHSDK